MTTKQETRILTCYAAVILPSFPGTKSPLLLFSIQLRFFLLSLSYTLRVELGVLSSFSLTLALDRWCRRPHPSEFYEWWQFTIRNTCCCLLLPKLFPANDTENSLRGQWLTGPWLFWDWEANNGHRTKHSRGGPGENLCPGPGPFTRELGSELAPDDSRLNGPASSRGWQPPVTSGQEGGGSGAGERNETDGYLVSPASRGIWSRYSPPVLLLSRNQD